MAFDVGRLSIDPSQRRVVLGGRDLAMRPLDVRVLAHLASDPGRAFTRTALAEALWGPGATDEARTIDTCVTRIRRALNDAGGAIVTVRRIGYRLDPGRLS